METTTISYDEVRDQLESALKKHNLTVDQFISMDIDELTDFELRDMWLMAKGLLK